MFSSHRAAAVLALSAAALTACSTGGSPAAATTYVEVQTVTASAPAAPTTSSTPAPAVTTVVQAPVQTVTAAPARTVTVAPARTVVAPAPEADPEPDTASCGSYYAQWDAAVQANSSSRSKRAHDRAAAAGCDPDRWLPSRAKSTYDPVTTHEKGSRCAMSEVGTYDAAGNVCTQDVEKHPHWN